MTRHRAAVTAAIAVALALAAAVSAAPARKAAPTPKPAPADTVPLAPLGMAPLNEVPGFWYTRAERTKYVQTSTYDETVAYLRRLEAATTWFSVQSYGRSGQGRDMVFVVASKDRAFTPAAARATGKPVVLVECGIHSGEIEGKDAMLAMLRDIAITGRQAALLDHCTLLLVPVFSADAHERRSRYNRINQNGPEEMGWRTSPIGLNLNRDWLKAEAPEMRAFLSKVYTRWWPDLLVDSHTTDGVDCQYDVTYGYNHGPEDPEPVNRWLADAFKARAVPATVALGHVVGPYLYLRNWSNPFSGIQAGDTPPRFSTGYPPLQCRPAILIETHMLKSYEVRVRATYDLISAILAEVNARPRVLLDAVAAAEAGIVARGRERDPAKRQVALSARLAADSVMFLFQGVRPSWRTSDISGAPVIRYSSTPLDTLVPLFSTLVPAMVVTQPAGYLVPQEWTSVVERLDVHGVRYRRFARAWSDTVEQERIVRWRIEDTEEPSEGHFPLALDSVVAVRRLRAFRPGDLWVPLDQRSALVAVHLLEARAPDGLARWNAFDTVLEKKEYAEGYVTEPLARRMMQDDPALAKEFRERVASDPAFARNPRARLEFFYRRSPWADPEQDLVPVARALRAPPEDALAR